jgi:hypothetical protein
MAAVPVDSSARPRVRGVVRSRPEAGHRGCPGQVAGRPDLVTRLGSPNTVMRVMPAGVTVRMASPSAW